MYAGDAQAAIFPASGSPYTVGFSDGNTTDVTLAGMDAFTVVSGYGDNGETAMAYPVEVAPYADATQGKVQVWNATMADVTVNAGNGDVTVAPGSPLDTSAATMAPGTYSITIDGAPRDIDVTADSYTDVFAVSDGTTPEIALATIPLMTELIAALTPTAPPADVTVPNVVDMAEADATAAIEEAGLVVGNTTTAPDDTIVAGNVISQTPAAGDTVAAGSAVDIVVSTGPDTPTTVPVPNVAGKSSADAQAELEAAGFAVTTEEQASETVEAGLVIETNPSAGTEVAPGTEVKMIVSSGVGDVVVPNFTGLTVDEATAVAEEAGLTIRFVEDADNPDPEGVVVSQDPMGGTTVEAGAEVVARLSPATSSPSVILTLGPEQVLTASGINFLPGSTVDLSVVGTDKSAKATVQGNGSWTASADLADVQSDAALLLIKGTAADGSDYASTFNIPAVGETTDEPTDESSGVSAWVWILLGLLVVAIVLLGIRMFGGGDTTTDGDDATGTDTPTTDIN